MDIAVANTWMMCSTLVVGEFHYLGSLDSFKEAFKEAVNAFDEEDTNFHNENPDYAYPVDEHAFFVASTISSQEVAVAGLSGLGFQPVGEAKALKTGNDVTLWFARVSDVLAALEE